MLIHYKRQPASAQAHFTKSAFWVKKNCLSAAVSVKHNLININLREKPGRRPFTSVQFAQLTPPPPPPTRYLGASGLRVNRLPLGGSLTQDEHRRYRLHGGGGALNMAPHQESWRKFDKGLRSASGIPPTQDLGSKERRGNDELERR